MNEPEIVGLPAMDKILQDNHPTFRPPEGPAYLDEIREIEQPDYRYVITHDCDPDFEAWVELWGDWADGEWFYSWRMMNLGSELTYPRGSLLISYCPFCGLHLAAFIRRGVCGYSDIPIGEVCEPR